LIDIKRGDISQQDELYDIAIQTYKETYTYLWMDGAAAYLKRFYKKEDLKKDLMTPGIYYFLVYSNNEVVGYFKIKENASETYSVQQCLEIEKLYLLRQCTGKGKGKIIMDFIFNFAKQQQLPMLWLKVMESSPAKLFYEAYGFTQTDRSYLDYPYMIDKYRWLLTYVLMLVD
jgi:ribosomal protein S18 acetylase RimI-like enzyme